MSGLAGRSLSRLRSWVETQGWAGYDPFDVRAHPFYLRLSRRARSGRWLDRAFLDLAYRFEQRWPGPARRLARVRPAINAKGMGLFARSYLMLARDGDPAAGTEAARRLEWLFGHPSDHPIGLSWGYPFHWESQRFIPAGTPSAVVTTIVADAIRFRHAISPTDDDRERLSAIGEFLAGALNRLAETEAAHCFSYTPIDSMHVHNANLLAAEFLLWAGSTLGRPDWVELGERAFRYTIDDQEPSGAWDYWGPPDRGRRKRTVDPYHTGFNLRMLLRAHETTGRSSFREVAERGYRFFVDHLLAGAAPTATETRAHPVNVHSVAETLLTLLAFRDIDAGATARAESLLVWARETFQDPAGFFYTHWSPRRTGRLPMMRWGQAWMFLALSAWTTGEKRP